VTDPVKNAQLQKAHTIAEYLAGGEWTDGYFERLEHVLGLKQEPTNGHTEKRSVENKPSAPTRPMTVDRPPQQRMAAPVSAPPHRDVPSMATGRAPSYRAPLTKDELEIAAASGMTAEQYQAQKERMLRMKAAGELNQ
jgi:hypothetical protein